MKNKATLYVVTKYDDNGNEIGREVFHIHQTSFIELDNKYNPNEYDIDYGRHTKHGTVRILRPARFVG